MNRSLASIAAWQGLAGACGYRVGRLARELGCSPRWLELHFQRRFHLTPHEWLVRQREREVKELACAGLPAKVICQEVGLADVPSLCHALKNHAGLGVRSLRKGVGSGIRKMARKAIRPQGGKGIRV